ncbi:capsid assembly scaffolding protein [Arthrobacter phage SWEP2]|uniref:Capsid assembly scaffolding protein n=1 Tax=Arthrobacter phage SWEP2 TaxID=2945958 RepID=A0A9E7MJ18_9CAUD|nr:capsid assembly scaffolding protein [Arthrobacter phage SWEP2]
MADTQNDADKDQKDGAAKTPDWTDENFDADRAKRLVANLRAEIAGLKDEVGNLKSENSTLKSNSGSESEKVTAAEARAAQAEKALWTERALRKHPELDEFVEFLDGDTEEAIMAKAERLAKIGAKGDSKPDADDKGGDADKDGQKPDADSGNKPDADKDDDDLPGKPRPDLRPGHGGDSGAPVDPEAIAKAARAARY